MKAEDDAARADPKKTGEAGPLLDLFAPPPNTSGNRPLLSLDGSTNKTDSLGGLPVPSSPETKSDCHKANDGNSINEAPPSATLKNLFDPPQAATPGYSKPGSSSLTSLFAPPSTNNNARVRAAKKGLDDRKPDESSLKTLFAPPSTTDNARVRVAKKGVDGRKAIKSNDFDPQEESTSLLGTTTNKLYSNDFNNVEGGVKSGMPSLDEEEEFFQAAKARRRSTITSTSGHKLKWHKFKDRHLQPSTFAGAVMFLLYHVVFCLANGSAIIRPDSMERPVLGMMTKLSAVGILFSAPFYILRLGSDIPALYPSIDLFLAPFLAQAAARIDAQLNSEYGGAYPDEVFFATFCVLTGIGMFFAGCFLKLAATFKLANLGTYLPYTVLCGFFSAVGVLLWALAFSVDTTGKTWKMVFFSGDPELIWDSCLHHFPTLVVGVLMNRVGPKNPFFIILLIVATLVCFYTAMWISGTSLEEAQRAKWFWSREELVFEEGQKTGLEIWSQPPAPFCNVWSLFSSYTNWKAVCNGLGDMAALAFLYLLRSSIHASALKKNVGNLVQRVPISKQSDDHNQAEARSSVFNSISETVQIVRLSMADQKSHHTSEFEDVGFALPLEHETPTPEDDNGFREIRPKVPRSSLEEIFVEYGYALFLVSVCGGFGNCPTVATSNTMYAIGADGPAPQFGSVLLLLFFYTTDFELVKYIPKTAFSSLLVLGAVDTLVVWFFGAFWKTQDITEWLVVPIIVLFSLFVGFLNAVFLGIGISMFIFVASFFRVGVVKFNATALEVRSRIERSIDQSLWLDENGDLIQVLVLQNYLFFGNASGVFSYIKTMFEEVDEAQSMRLNFILPPLPKVLVLDLSLISGMDTSTLDIFAEIAELCKLQDCKLYFCGLSSRMRKGLALVGIKPEMGARSKRSIRFFPDLDTALGKAEDFLIHTRKKVETPTTFQSANERGFQYALKQIDELHGEKFSDGLLDLKQYVVQIELEQGQCLFQCDGGFVRDSERGLFFIESGELKIERDVSQTVTLTRTKSSQALNSNAVLTLKHKHARMGTLARRGAAAKSGMHSSHENLRVMRIGPGWVCGTLENASGLKTAGVTVAVRRCILHHLPFSRLEELEREQPLLVIRLFKMLQYLMARKEEITIDHLTTLHNIMSSPAHSKPLSKATLQALARG